MKVQRRRDLEVFMAARQEAEDHHIEYVERLTKDHKMRFYEEMTKDGQDEEHRSIVHRLEHEHQEKMDKLNKREPEVLEVEKNDTELPLVLSNGVVVLPGHYYVAGDNPFGISDEELATEYVEV